MKIWEIFKKKEQPMPEKKRKKSSRFGGESMTLGEANESFPSLNGAKIKRMDNGKTGTIKTVLINRQTEVVQIWANMDEGYMQCFRPNDIEFTDNTSSALGISAKSQN